MPDDILSRSAEIKGVLRYCGSPVDGRKCWDCPAAQVDGGCRQSNLDALALIEAQEARIAELEAGRRPIPVTERLPEEHGTYLVFRDIGGGLFEWDTAEWRGRWLGGRWATYITHWMPLPEPPEEDGTDEAVS